MENNFIQMAASLGHTVAYTIGSIFKRIVDYVQLYFTNGFMNIVQPFSQSTPSILSVVCICISPMASRILSFKASIVSGLSA